MSEWLTLWTGRAIMMLEDKIAVKLSFYVIDIFYYS